MLELILMLSLSGLAADTTLAGGPFTTCQWPNTCKDEVQTVVLAQFQPCVLPNRCKDAQTFVF